MKQSQRLLVFIAVSSSLFCFLIELRNIFLFRGTPQWSGEKTTLVMMAYSVHRAGNWNRIRSSYCHMPDVFEKILFIWQNPTQDPPVFTQCSLPLKVIKTTANSMNNRYRYYAEVSTRTTFSVDDDVLVPKNLIYDMIQMSASTDLVGLDARSFSSDGSYSFWGFMYPNKLVLPKTWILPVQYWKTYVNDQVLQNFIDRGNACEDLAMNFIVRVATRKEPRVVTAGLFEQQRLELSEQGGLSIVGDRWKWAEKRSACIKWLLAHFPDAKVL